MSPTDTNASAARARNERSYSLDGLAARDALVFKSLVRLLGHRTNDVWMYLPSSTELHVVADGLPVSASRSTFVQQVLTLGVGNVKRHAYLRLPLHANELETELNRLGALITPRQKTAASEWVADDSTPMRMLRWSPAAILMTTTRVRLATLMAGKPLTIAELQQRSKENLAICAAFFDDLRQLNLLIPAATVQPTAIASTQPVAATNQPQTNKKSVQPGLLERIRMRLGLQISSMSGQASRT